MGMPSRRVRAGLVSVLLFGACGGNSGSSGAPDAGAGSGDPPAVAASTDHEWVITARDERGAPRFLWSTASATPIAATPADAAREQLERTAEAFAVGREALATLHEVRTVTLRSGATVSTFRQRVNGVEVYGRETSVLLRPDRSLVAISGSPHGAATGSLGAAFPLAAEAAVELAILDVTGERVLASAANQASGAWSTFTIQHPDLIATAPVRARRVLFVDGDRLVPAYAVELGLARASSTSSTGSHRVIDATTGRVLEAKSLTAKEAFEYRVWADATSKRPFDDPYTNFTPHPTGNPDGSQPTPTAASLVSMQSFNTPPNGAVDPWLPANATTTQGNNVDAYTDRFAPDGFTSGQDLYATTTGTRRFDHAYDLNASALANSTQSRAGVTSAFYVANWLHDYWYDSGFDEAAGNAQENNFGRGGLGGDRMLVEVQDSADSQRDNANMFTPGDGSPPRMQIYVWSPQETRYVRATPGTANLDAGNAEFGPQSFDLTDDLVLAIDAAAPANDACTAVTNGAAITGKIAIIDRGNCNYTVKVKNVQNAGAVGAIIVDNVAAAVPPAMGGTDNTITIPALSITQAAGNQLKTQISTTATTVHMVRTGGQLREGALDTGLVAHEWGHYLHYRFTGGCSSQQCGAISEGWGDFLALHTMLRAGDNLAGTYAVAAHAGASFGNSWYWGIRRTPYSTNQNKNPLTFRHIGDSQALPAGGTYQFTGQNSEVHNAGEIWAQMMFEGYTRILANPGARNFDAIRRDMADYVVGGLALTPVEATFTEQRDAILAAAAASSPADFGHLARAFATRGAGTCAVGPASSSFTLDGVVESFTVAPKAAIGTIRIDDSRATCDRDGILDAQETGVVTVRVSNVGAAALADGQLEVTSTTPGVTFPSGTTATIASVASMGFRDVTIPIALAANFPDQGTVALTVTVRSASSCTQTITTTASLAANRNETANSSTTDTVEATTTTWTLAGTDAAAIWSRLAQSATQHVWQGIDYAAPSDTQLVSPALVVGTAPFSMTIRHAYRFETSSGTDYDGGVVEISDNNGATWTDASMYGATGYDGTLDNTSGNPLGGRMAYTGNSPGYPTLQSRTISFGTAFASKTVKVRFRIGTDAAVGESGWLLDDIAFTGITNKPFRTVGNDTTTCMAPIANAGPDQTRQVSTLVTLDGSASSDPNNDPLTFTWTQTLGPTVALTGPSTRKPTFTAPASPTTLRFQLRVNDGWTNATDTVNVTVVNTQPPVDAGVPDAPPPDAPVDAPIDAPVDAPPPPDDAAMPDAAIDAGIPDAAIDAGTEPDAGIPADADVPTPDAATEPPAPSDGGCCSSGGDPVGQLPALFVVGGLLIRRRRRPRA